MPKNKRGPRRYTVEILNDAIKAVKDGKSIRQAAKMFGIPTSTLHDKVTGKSEPATLGKIGGKCLLSDKVEQQLSEWLINLDPDQAVLGKTQPEVLDAVKLYLDNSGTKIKEFNDNRPGRKWLHGFFRRRPEVSAKHGKNVRTPRCKRSADGSIKGWFRCFKRMLRRNQITDRSQIYSAAEIGYKVENTRHINFTSASRRPIQLSKFNNKNKMYISSLHCISADGTAIPPSLHFPGKLMSASPYPSDYHVGSSADHGWMECAHFSAWIEEHFLKFVEAVRPLVLIVDKRLIDVDVRKVCKYHNIILQPLLVRTSLQIQPCEKDFFSTFEDNLTSEVNKYVKKHRNALTKGTFHKVFVPAYQRTVNIKVIKASYKHSGVWPVDLNAAQSSTVYFQPKCNNGISGGEHDDDDDSDSESDSDSEEGESNSESESESSDDDEAADDEIVLEFMEEEDEDDDEEEEVESESESDVKNSVIAAVLNGGTIPEHHLYKTLVDFERGLGKKKLSLFKKRQRDGVRLDEPTYKTWLELHEGWEQKKVQLSEALEIPKNQRDDELCGTCRKRYKKREVCIQCDKCEMWHHLHCTDQRDKDPDTLDNISWKCCELADSD